jgi:hypothetical protein
MREGWYGRIFSRMCPPERGKLACENHNTVLQLTDVGISTGVVSLGEANSTGHTRFGIPAQIIAEYCPLALTLAEESQAPSQWNGCYMEAGLRRRLTLLANCHFPF